MKEIKNIIEQIKKKIGNSICDDISNLLKIPTKKELEVITQFSSVA